MLACACSYNGYSTIFPHLFCVPQANDLDSHKKFPSKSCPLRYGTAKIQEDAMKLFVSGLHEFLGWQNIGWRVTSLSVTASKLLDIPRVSFKQRYLEAIFTFILEGFCHDVILLSYICLPSFITAAYFLSTDSVIDSQNI